MLVEVYGHTLEEKIFEEFNQIRDIWKRLLIKKCGANDGANALKIKQKALVIKAFTVGV